MKNYRYIVICIFVILLFASMSVYAVFWALWKAPVTVRVDPLTPRSTDLSVSCDPPQITMGEMTTVHGELANATSEEGIPDQTIGLYYKSSTDTLWNLIDYVVTMPDGTYSCTWDNSSRLDPGYYAVNATFSGSVDYDPWTSVTDFQVRSQILLHDINITSVTPSKTVVSQGYSMLINVTVENQGDYTETFNLAVYVDGFELNSDPAGPLASGSSITVPFTWNTTGFAKSNYTISAVVDTVPGETDTADNTLINGVVMVTTPGDVDGNGHVDLDDLYCVLIGYGARMGDPDYDPNVDIDNDGEIDLDDLHQVLWNYGV